MKKIEAIIKESKFQDVKIALHNVGVNFFSYWDVNTVRNQGDDYLTLNTLNKTNTFKKSYLSIVVNDDFEAVTIKAILDSASTGNLEDGRIFVSNIDEAYKIKTKQNGSKTLR